MTVENTTIKSRIKNLLRSPSIKLRRSKAGNNKENLSNKVTLEKVLGITSAGNRALACDPHSGLVAYPAGCVVVLLNPKKNKQHHILNSSRKTITTVSFSPDGKYVVTGESGHMPAVRVWDVAERTQVAELHEHKYGVACVAFSPNSKYIVSVGYQHDMIVNVWAWKKNVVVAANKVSSKVTAVSFSDDSSYFVTAGNRHVKFWYLDHTKSSKMNATVPLLGRAGLLGELRNNFFSDVACGKGRKANSTFCITSSGLLCEFNDKRMLDKWVELRTSMATSLSVSEDLIFCGCADGTVRAFSPTDLHFIYTLPHPHSLGTDIATVTEASHLFAYKKNVRYPDTVAVSYDPTNRWLSCVYSDHSLYVWDVRDLRKVGKVYSALYHSACVWSVEVYPETRDGESRLSPGSFLSCSSDNTIRLWNTDAQNTTLSRNVISNDLQKVIYMDSNTSSLLDTECTISSNSEKVDPQTSDNRTGIRTICVSPDGLHLASGDRNGTLRIHDLESMEEILDVQAHDSEILCLEYSKPETGLKLLATASRDRLIHVLDADQEYSLLQTLDEHSSSITAVRFAANDGKVRMISCGADKSIYFRTAQKTEEGTAFTRAHHIVRKTTLHDMDVDPTQKYAVIGCQDRSIRIFNICNGKQKKVYKGSQGEDGTVIKVQTDPSGLYVATSCSDKNISIFDFYTGECVANMFGHSEIVTGMKFTNDCKNLISVSGDSCIFVWRLCPELTINMRQRLSDLKQNSKPQKTPPNKQHTLSARNEIHSAPVIGTMSSDSDKDVEEEEGIEEEDEMFPRMSSGSSGGEETGSSEEKRNTLNSHMKKQSKSCEHEGSGPRPRRRWSMRLGSMDLKVKSMLDLRQLESFAKPFFPSKTQDVHKDLPPHRNQELGSTISLQTIAAWVPEENEPGGQTRPLHIRLSPQTPETEVLYPEGCEEDQISLAGSEYQVKKLPHGVRCAKVNSSPEKQSPDSACSMEYSSSHLSSPEHPGEDSEPTEPLSVDGNSSELDMEDLDEEEEDSLRKNEVQTPVPQTPDQEAFLKRHFANLSDLINTDSFSLAASPPGVTPNISDSMSSKFLSQNSPSRTAFPFPSNKSNDIKTTSGAVQPLISEVRPLMENKSPGKQQESHGTERTTGQRLIQKKRTPVMDSRRLISPVAKAAASHNSSAGMRKAQSIHNISSEADMVQTSSRPSKEVHPQPQTPDHPQMQRPRRSLPTVPLTSPTTTLPRDIATPTKSRSRSYMSPTTSSMAKMTRSVSMGDNLNVVELEDTGSSDLHRGSSSNSSNPQSASQSKPTTPVAQVSSPNTSASPFPGPYAAVIPTLSAGSTGNSSSRGLQVKLTGSARPLLHIDIPNPIPDKPLLSSLSPCSKTKLAKKEKEPSSRTPTTPSSNPGAVHLPNSIVQPVTAVCLNTSETPDQIELSMVLVPSQTKNLTEDELHSHTEPRKEDTAEAECPPMSQCSLSVLQSSSGSQDSGLLGHQSSLVASSVLLRLGLSKHFFTKGLWPLSSSTSTITSFISSSPSPPINYYHLQDTSLSVDSCRLVANELQSSFKRASQLYKMLSNSTDSSEEQQEMARVLAEAFEAMRDELNCLPPCTPSRSPSTCTVRTLANSDAALGDDRTLALLEQYSKLLLSAVEKRMDNKI
ncbi:mitogen-activated protein kinase-binding protein 1-like isoform X2 [Sinocyclocheilus anshuiensis]|uniref:mitogen-activated protein kinase-binding protein 1-like isoform X2 n=1 Tax=Sinocyclocheilus anshuiensis TaxID=1608454 RepID=UPI0007BA0453|nr:PREDICTED: mitogen-activated protein kinase-binding protein 1-like isoform X2 [Sinocyclocheilus anshuiensis]